MLTTLPDCPPDCPDAPQSVGELSSATHFCCSECGNKQGLFAERKFQCERCGHLLDVRTNYSGLKLASAQDLRREFDTRAAPKLSVYHQSGVWRFQELFWPEAHASNIVSVGEGIIPILPAGPKLREWVGGELDLHFILEGQNPSGSFKDMGMTAMITLAKLAGALRVSCASTGDTSAALAQYAAAAGIPCDVLLPLDKVTGSQLTQPVYYGARVIGIPGDFDDCMRIQNALIALGSYPGNSKNPMRIAGHMATAFLLAQYFDWRLPDWTSVPLGNGSDITSIGMGMRRLVKLGIVKASGRILGCQTEMANPLASSWNADPKIWLDAYRPMKAGDTIATATQIGAPVSHRKVIREVTHSNGCMQTATEADIRKGMEVCLSDGFPVCPQTGIAIAGLRNAVQAGSIERGSLVSIVSTATTLKFTGLFNEKVERVVEIAPDTSVGSIAKMLGL